MIFLVRKKVYKKQHILAAAQELLIEQGFSAITARNVAEYMGISTQPIYLEFKSMEELKLTLLKTTHKHLEAKFLSKTQTANQIVDFGLNYIDLATSNSKLYISLYIDQHSYGQELRELSFLAFQQSLQKEERYATATKEQLEQLHLDLWIVVTGIASLSLSGIVDRTPEQLKVIFETIEQNCTI